MIHSAGLTTQTTHNDKTYIVELVVFELVAGNEKKRCPEILARNDTVTVDIIHTKRNCMRSTSIYALV